jgi:hypothetical protein
MGRQIWSCRPWVLSRQRCSSHEKNHLKASNKLLVRIRFLHWQIPPWRKEKVLNMSYLQKLGLWTGLRLRDGE